MPAPSYVGFTGAPGDVSIGASAETGILVGDIDFTLENPRVDFFDEYGALKGFARNHAAAYVLNVTGEVDDKNDGLNVMNMTSAVTPANLNFFASATATHHTLDFSTAETFLDEVSGSQPRGGARTASFTYRRHLGMDFTAEG